MKRFIPGIAILLILSLTACSAPKTPPKDTGDASNSQSEGIIRLDEGEWPVNEYTEGLPVPTGTVAWAMLDTEHGNFSISIAGIDENDYDNYMELLIQEGFSVVENVSEKIKGENWCCTIKVDIENSKGQYIEKDKQEATKDGSESTKIQHGI